MGVERRRHKRLLVKYDLLCHEVDSKTSQPCIGQTINVSPGGLYFETSSSEFSLGSLLQVELSIPPTHGELEFGGRISGFGKVVRACRIHSLTSNNVPDSKLYGIALQFSHPLRLLS
jgi:hypothetical protein